MTDSQIIRALKLKCYCRSSAENIPRKAKLLTSPKTGGAMVGNIFLKFWVVFLVNLSKKSRNRGY